jgi:hypothetical protein
MSRLFSLPRPFLAALATVFAAAAVLYASVWMYVERYPSPRTGDRIIGVNGHTLNTSAPYDEAYGRGQPGDAVDLTIQRDGEAWPLVLHGIFRASAEGADMRDLPRLRPWK